MRIGGDSYILLKAGPDLAVDVAMKLFVYTELSNCSSVEQTTDFQS